MSAFGFAMILAAVRVAAAAEPPLTIEQLLARGWEIAGYASGYDNRTSLILFRHPGHELPRPVRDSLRRDAQAARDRQLLRAALMARVARPTRSSGASRQLRSPDG